MQTNWTKNELKAYTFIYLMNADLKELNDEIDFIKSKVGEDIYTKMHVEFDADNDYKVVQKIKSAHDALGYSTEEDELFFSEMKTLILEDNENQLIEQGLFSGLKKILKN